MSDEIVLDNVNVFETDKILPYESSQKKRKFSKLKNKKQAAIEEVKAAEIQSNYNELIPEEQCTLLKMSFPALSNTLLHPSNFYSPDLQENTGYVFSTLISNFNRDFRITLNSHKVVGNPLVVIVCSGARAAASVINGISKDMKCKIGKLFAKHFKIKDQVEALKYAFPIVVGTPNRLSKLISLGSLSLRSTKLVVVDVSKDAKDFSILTMPEVSEDFYTLFVSDILPNVNNLKISLASC
jgi:hypothetical protein